MEIKVGDYKDLYVEIENLRFGGNYNNKNEIFKCI